MFEDFTHDLILINRLHQIFELCKAVSAAVWLLDIGFLIYTSRYDMIIVSPLNRSSRNEKNHDNRR